MDRTHTESLPVVDLGRMAYAPAVEVQRRYHADVVAGERPSTLLLVEHDPVITMGRRAKTDHLLADPDQLKRQGVDVVATDRGGDVTYHGPGQLVVYPIVQLNDMGLNLRSYVRALEQAIIDTAAEFGIAAQRDACAVGVWVPTAAGATAKLAAIGVRAERHVTLHGLALNVCPDLDHFKLIVPCGLAGRAVTSMAEMLGDRCPTMETTKARLALHLDRALVG